jgi:arylsulfatase A-like enzyme
MKNNIDYRILLIWLGILAMASACQFSQSSSSQDSSKPNIILIVADDLGYDFLGSYGDSLAQTPNLDRLANNGVKFNAFYVNSPVCSPSRASILTGLYPQKTGVTTVVKPGRKGINPGIMTVAEKLKHLGYATGIIGKWHLGFQKEEHPLQQGFDHFLGTLSGHADYISHYRNDGKYDMWHEDKVLHQKGHITEIITEKAIQFIDKQNRPFFLYVPYQAPHSAYLLPGEEANFHAKNTLNTKGFRRGDIQNYRKLISLMDENIGRLYQFLAENGLLENTLIWFVSDNGEPVPIHQNYDASFRGAKGLLLESGIRVPALVYWKNHFQGHEIDEPVMGADIFPTLLDMLDTLPHNIPFDGQSILPLLTDSFTQPLERKLYWQIKGASAVRSGRWKVVVVDPASLNKNRFNLYFDKNYSTLPKDSILTMGKKSFLFDIYNDPQESKDLSEKHPEILLGLKKDLETWVKKTHPKFYSQINILSTNHDN